MSTPYVTIGGQEVALPPDRALLHRTPPVRTPATSQPPCEPALWCGRGALIVGLIALLGLAVILVARLSRQRCAP